MKMARKRNKWTDEDDETLIQYAEQHKHSLKTIAKNMNRSKSSIMVRLKFLGYENLISLNGRIRASELAEMLGMSKNGIRYWIDHKGLPYNRKNYSLNIHKNNIKNHRYAIDLDAFWKWAKKNQELLDFRKIPETTLYNAPEWVWELRKNRLPDIPLNHRREWSKAQEDYLLFAIKGKNVTLSSLAKHFNREPVYLEAKIRKLANKHKFKFSVHKGIIFINKPKPSLTNQLQSLADKQQTDIKTLLTEWYWIEGLSFKDITKKVTGSDTQVAYFSTIFKRLDIPTRKFNTHWVQIGIDTHLVKGRMIQDGRSYLLIPSHPNKNSTNRVLEAKIEMERYLGRYLAPFEYIAFLNGNKLDTRIENLQLKVYKKQLEQTA